MNKNSLKSKGLWGRASGDNTDTRSTALQIICQTVLYIVKTMLLGKSFSI